MFSTISKYNFDSMRSLAVFVPLSALCMHADLNKSDLMNITLLCDDNRVVKKFLCDVPSKLFALK